MRYCGQALPGTMTVNSTSISLRFRSDAISAGRGFLATYTTLADNGKYIVYNIEQFSANVSG